MKITIENDVYGLDIKDLVVMASRANNKKRNFLFVSKVLGKHIEVKPDICRVAGYLLVSRLYGKNNSTKKYIDLIKGDNVLIKEDFYDIYKNSNKDIVIGFAETATGLGMAVASAIENSYYITTTREDITELKSILKFEEEHSHATTHKCFLGDLDKLKNANRIILVDDEITTGKSMLNIIRELKAISDVKEYIILSLLDWRNSDYKELYEKFMKEENIKINVLSLISGTIESNNKEVFKDSDGCAIRQSLDVVNLNKLERCNYKIINGVKSYIRSTGRFGVSHEEIRNIEHRAKDIARAIEEEVGISSKTLVLGHGENIYIPSRVAACLKGDVYFKSTTRSPIYCKDIEGYPIREKHCFDFEGVKYYFYNKSYCESNYDRVILLTEDDINLKLTNNLVIFKL